MLDAHVMQVKLCKANTRGVTPTDARVIRRPTQVAHWPPLDGDSVGLARLGSNEKVEMTMSASGQTGQGPLGAHLCFSPSSV